MSQITSRRANRRIHAIAGGSASVAAMIIEQALLKAIGMHTEDRKVMQNSQYGFIKVQSGLTAFYMKMTGSVDRGRAQCHSTLTLASLLE